MSIIRHVHHRAKRHFDLYYRARYAAKAHLIFAIDSLLVLAVLALLGLGSYFAYFYHPLRDDFRVEVITGETFRAGEVARVAVRVSNEGQHTLQDAVLTLHPPVQFLLRDNPTVEIASLPPQASVVYDFYGLLIGPPAEERVYAHFTASTAEGIADEKLASDLLVWKENLVEARFDIGYDHFIAGEDVFQSVTIENAQGVDLKGVVLRPTWPEGFRLRRATPPARRDGSFFIGDVPKGAMANLEFIGRFSATQARPHFLIDVVAEVEGRTLTVARAETETIGAIDLKLSAVTSFDAASVVPGGTVTVNVEYAHEGDATLREVKIFLPIDPAIVDARGFDPEDGLYVPPGEGETAGHIAWSPGNTPELAEILPGEKGRVSVEMRLKSPLARTVTNAVLEARPAVSFHIVKDGLIGGTVTATPASIKVDGTVSLDAVARYFTAEGDQVGRGPLPPRVGKQTTYWISMAARTSSNPIREGRLAVVLPAGVEWTGRAVPSVGGVEPYLDSVGRLTWDLPEAEAWGGYVSPLAGLTFEVALVPTAGQAGSEARLMESASFQAIDAWTGASLKAVSGPLTTALPADATVKGRTEVQP